MRKVMFFAAVIIFIITMSTPVLADLPSASAAEGSAAIDGKNTSGEWDNVSTYPISTFKSGTGMPGETTGSFKAKWDGSSLYLFVEINDKTVSKKQGTDFLQDQDNLQVYIDFDNTGEGHYLEPESNQFQFCIDRSGQFGIVDCREFDLENNLVKEVVDTATGYVVEFKINLAKITGITVSGNKEIGFDLQINDWDESTGSRTAAYAWADETDTAWVDSTVLGNLNIKGSGSQSPANTESSAPSETGTPEATNDGSSENNGNSNNTLIVIAGIIIVVIVATGIGVYMTKRKK